MHGDDGPFIVKLVEWSRDLQCLLFS